MKYGPWIIAACVIAAVAATLIAPASRLARHMAGQTGAISVPAADVIVAGNATNTDPAGIENVLAFAPFGAVYQPTDPVREGAPARRLDIDLHGLLVASDPAQSRALIAFAGSVDRYRIGDLLAEGVELIQIVSDGVTITVDGQARRFGFDGALDAAPAAQSEAAEAGPDIAAASPLDRLRAAIVPGRGSLDLREAPPPETTQDYIDLWRARIIDDPQSVLDTIGLVPGARGYTVDDNPNIGVTLAGLRPGDLVTRVNGRDVGDPEQDRSFYDDIAASGQARLEVMRAGETLLMSFPLR